MDEKKCEQCGKVFTRPKGKSQRVFAARRFCSQACHYAARRDASPAVLRKRRCAHCRAILVRRPQEPPSIWLQRKSCNRACGIAARTTHTRESVAATYRSCPLPDRHVSWRFAEWNRGCFSAIRRIYGRNAWRRFLMDVGDIDLLARDHANPKVVRHARALLRYWRVECGFDVGAAFHYTQRWGIPLEGYETVSEWHVYDAIRTLVERGVVGIVEPGRPGRIRGVPTKYVLNRLTF